MRIARMAIAVAIVTGMDRVSGALGVVGRASRLAVPITPSATHFSSRYKSRADCQRSFGSFARHVVITRSSDSGATGCKAVIGLGVSFKIALIKLTGLVP